MTDSIVALAQHALDFKFASLSAEELAMARMIAMDTVAVGMAGSMATFAATLRETARNWGSTTAAALGCRVLGHGAHYPAATAAFLNAYQIHGQEFDCVHEAAVVHPMAAIMAAALAELEQQAIAMPRRATSGQEFIAALSAATDVAIAVGLSATVGLRFFRPGTAGAFGAAAVVSRLRGYSLDSTLLTFGHVYSQLCGTMQAHTEGAAVLPMQIGFNARNAIVAADLAAAGITAPLNVFDGPFGYFQLYEPGGDIAPLLAKLDSVRRITELSYKPFPTGRATHGGLDGLLLLCAKHDIAASQVKSVVITGPPLVHRLVARPITRPLVANYARLCMQYTGALAITRGAVNLFDFDLESLESTELHTLAARIRVVDDQSTDANALLPQTISLEALDGSIYQHSLDRVFGSPANPMSHDQHIEKIVHCGKFAAIVRKPHEVNSEHAATKLALQEKKDCLQEFLEVGLQLEKVQDVTREWLSHAYSSSATGNSSD